MDMSQDQEPTTARTGLIRDMLAYQAGEYLQAVKHYRQILDAEPRNVSWMLRTGT